LTGERATVLWATVPFCISEFWDMEKDEYEAARVGAFGDDAGGALALALLLLRLRSARKLLCLGGRSSLAMLRTWPSEKGAGD